MLVAPQLNVNKNLQRLFRRRRTQLNLRALLLASEMWEWFQIRYAILRSLIRDKDARKHEHPIIYGCGGGATMVRP